MGLPVKIPFLLVRFGTIALSSLVCKVVLQLKKALESILLISYMCNVSRQGNPNCLEITKQTYSSLNPASSGQIGNLDPYRQDILHDSDRVREKNGKMEGGYCVEKLS